MLPHSEPAVPMLVTVAPWGIMDTAELANAVVAANAAQGRFRFGLSREALPLDAESYRLPDGGLDLDKAARDLVRRKPFRQLASGNLILVTTEPYSAPGAVGSEGEINPLPGYFHDDDVLGDGRVSIVSTFLWDRLPSKPDLDVLAPSGGRRVQTPYLLRTGESISVGLSPFAPRKPRSFAERKATLISAPVLMALATIVIGKLFDTECHLETLACPNDYCDNIEDIDAFFARGRWFCEELCNPALRRGVELGRLHIEQWKAGKRILNRARGRPADEGFDSCFICYGEPDRAFARRLYKDLRARGIECWFYDEDSLPGDPTWRSINDARRLAERILTICSSESLKRTGVRKEIELQVDDNRDKVIPVSLDKE